MMYGRWDGSSAPWYGRVFGPIMMIVFIVLTVVIIAWLLRRTDAIVSNVWLNRILSGNGKVLLCGTCMDARGLDAAALVAGARRSTMDELAAATSEADKVIVF